VSKYKLESWATDCDRETHVTSQCPTLPSDAPREALPLPEKLLEIHDGAPEYALVREKKEVVLGVLWQCNHPFNYIRGGVPQPDFPSVPNVITQLRKIEREARAEHSFILIWVSTNTREVDEWDNTEPILEVLGQRWETDAEVHDRLLHMKGHRKGAFQSDDLKTKAWASPDGKKEQAWIERKIRKEWVPDV